MISLQKACIQVLCILPLCLAACTPVEESKTASISGRVYFNVDISGECSNNEYGEPAHIHVQRDNMLAKFRLEPVSLASPTRFPTIDVRKIRSLVMENRELLLEAWNEHFGC